MEPEQPRSYIYTAGVFVSMPEIFEGVDNAVKYAPKIEIRVKRSDDSRQPLKLENVRDVHRLLIDLGAVDSSALDPRKLIRDCELIKYAAETNPEKLKSVLGAFAEDASYERIQEAARTLEEIDLSESQVIHAGGGFLWLLAITAAFTMSTCDHCQVRPDEKP
jgi:hypothetical protein